MSFIDQGTHYLASLADKIPVYLFVFIGAFIEEVIAPIPSPVIMTLAGSIAEAQGKPFMFLFFLSVFGAVAKTLGSWVVYFIADKTEDVVLTKFGKFFGVTHKDVENIGKLLDKGPKEIFIIFMLRAIPIIPTAPVSLVCGLIKVNVKNYLYATFFGTIIRNFVYLYLGFQGTTTLENLNSNFDSWEKYGYLTIFALLAILAGWIYKKKKSGFAEKIMEKIKRIFG